MSSPSRQHRHGMPPFRAGLLTLSIMAVGMYFGFTKDLPFTGDRTTISAVFSSAASEIQANAPVRIAGVNVGKVKTVARGPGTSVVVRMELEDHGLPLHRDATAKIRPRLFLEGNFFVELTPGSPSAPELIDEDRIPLAQTAIPVQLDQLVGVFTADTRQSTRDLLAGYADALDNGGAQALNRSFEDWPGAFSGTAVTMEALRGERTDDLSAFVRDQATINDALAARREDLGTLLTAFSTTVTALAERQADLRATVRESSALLAKAPPVLADLDRFLPPLRRFAVALRPALEQAPGVLDRTRPLLRALAQLSAQRALPALARDLTPAAVALTRLDRALPRLLDDVERVSDCVREKIVPVLNKTVPDGHLTTDQPVWQEALRFPIGLAGAQQNFDGNGASTRYSIGLDRDVVTTSLGTPEQLLQISPSPMLGSRPKFTPGSQPPIRPESDCRDQTVANLSAETVPPPRSQRRIRLRPARAWTRETFLKHVGAATKRLQRQAGSDTRAPEVTTP